MMSSHARCGASSAASALTSHNAPLARLWVDKWSRGTRAVIQSVTTNTSITVGVSMHTLGVTSLQSPSSPLAKCGPVRVRQCAVGIALWLDSAHYISTTYGKGGWSDFSLAVTNVDTGETAAVPESNRSKLKSLTCKKPWILDWEQWNLWKVHDVNPPMMKLSQPRKLRFSEGGVWYFSDWVDGGHSFCVSNSIYCGGLLQSFICHLIDAEGAFESGVMVPVETVRFDVPHELIIPEPFPTYFFWEPKRFLFDMNDAMYELMRDGTTRVLFRKPTTNPEVIGNFVVAQSEGKLEVWNLFTYVTEPVVIKHRSLGSPSIRLWCAGDFLAVEDGSRAHLFDPSSGVVIFTLSVNKLLKHGLFLNNNASFLV
ncbi:hypothetical protein Pelo_14794 [Pelomyxa schiedti]|nr:hypothetical protein Pelo_14794 [Pelomyxa schiedti]